MVTFAYSGTTESWREEEKEGPKPSGHRGEGGPQTLGVL